MASHSVSATSVDAFGIDYIGLELKQARSWTRQLPASPFAPELVGCSAAMTDSSAWTWAGRAIQTWRSIDYPADEAAEHVDVATM